MADARVLVSGPLPRIRHPMATPSDPQPSMSPWRQILLIVGALATLWVIIFRVLPDSVFSPSIVVVHDHSFAIEIAATPAQWERGLMDRPILAPGHGMLFVFPSPAKRAFWMKRTRMPLDLLFFDAQWRVVGVVHGAAPCTGDPCPTYSSPATTQYVLEVTGGSAAAIGVQLGDRFRFYWFTLDGPPKGAASPSSS